MNIDEVINGWTFEETVKTAESLMEDEKNMFKWDVIRHLRDFVEAYREQLEEHQQLEEQGRLVKLPCKVGDVLYRVNKGAKEPVIMMRVLQLYIKQLHKDRTVIKIIAINDDNMGESCYFLEDIGKTVFLTKSEAEARLKELRGVK